MEYDFVTVWRVEAPLEKVWEAVSRSLDWPQWWHNVESVRELAPGDAQGVGNIRRYAWRGRLPYRLVFDIRVTRIEPMVAIAGVASGDLEGRGSWSFTAAGTVTVVRHEWQVRTTSVWMNLLELFARPLIERNHDFVMDQGGRALARRLNARLAV